MSFNSINIPISGSRNPVSYVSGLTAELASLTTLNLNPGSCSDSLNIIDMVVQDNLIIDSAANGVLGLDTGALAANKFYYVFVIGDSNGFNLPSALISLSSTAPFMPYGYDSWRMVDIKLTDGSSEFIPTFTTGDSSDREFIYTNPLTTGSSALTTSYVALPLTNCVAPVGTTNVSFIASFTPFSAGNIGYLQPTGGTGDGAKLSGVVAGVAQVADLECPAFVVSGAASISLKGTAATDTLVLLVKSFTFNV